MNVKYRWWGIAEVLVDTLYEIYRGYEIYLVVGVRGRLYTVSVPADGEVWRAESSAVLRCHINDRLDGPPVPRS